MSEKNIPNVSDEKSQPKTSSGEQVDSQVENHTNQELAKKVAIHAFIKSPLMITVATSTYRNLTDSWRNISQGIKEFRQAKKDRANDPNRLALLAMQDAERFNFLAQKNNLSQNDFYEREIVYRKRALIYFIAAVIVFALILGFMLTNFLGVLFSIPVFCLTYVLCLRENYYATIFERQSLIKFKSFLQGKLGFNSFILAIRPIPSLVDIQLRPENQERQK